MSLVPTLHRTITENLDLKARLAAAKAADQRHIRNTVDFLDSILASGTPAPDTGSAWQMRQFADSVRALLTSPVTPSTSGKAL